MSEFQGKRILVTGGASGLGEAVARAFVKLEATVFVADRNVELLSKLKESLPEIQTLELDLTDWEGTTKAVQEIAPIHHLVNNAGIFTGARSLLDVDEKEVDRTFNINFKAAVNVGQAMVKGLVAKNLEGGTIVNISSVLSGKALDKGAMYCCSKAAISMLTKCQAIEFGPQVRVNAVRPTVMKTNIFNCPEDFKLVVENIQNRQVNPKLLETQEAAEVVVFLSSSKSSMITGEEIVIDGGYLLH